MIREDNKITALEVLKEEEMRQIEGGAYIDAFLNNESFVTVAQTIGKWIYGK